MWAVIRVRGTSGISPKIKKTLQSLKLLKPHHMVLVDENTSSKNMVLRAKDYLAFGEIDFETLLALMEKRGRLIGDKRLTNENLKNLKAQSLETIAKKAIKDPKILRETGIKTVFRLNSPSKGFERGGIKKAFVEGGTLGYRGEKINGLLSKMM